MLLRCSGVIGTLEEMLCEVGSRFYTDEEVAVIETDKSSISVRAQHGGVVTAVLVSVGDDVREDQPLYEAVHSTAKPKITIRGAIRDANYERGWAEQHQQKKEELAEQERKEYESILAAWHKKRDEEWRLRREQMKRERARWRQQYRTRGGQDTTEYMSGSPWLVLGLQPGATQSEIKAAFRLLAFKFHPDQNSDVGAEDKFKEIRMAYDVLMMHK